MYRLSSGIIALFLIILATGSCKSGSKKDLSLTVEEYRKLGMPDHNKTWTNDDYVNANITLSTLKTNYPLSLPRKNSKKSGEVFSRIVNEANLSFIQDTVFPLRIRAYLIQYFTHFESELEQFYSVESEGENYYKEELVDLKILGLFVHEKMLELAWIIMDSDDESDKSIQSGMQAVKHNYVRLIVRLLDEQVKTDEYKTMDLGRLSDKISVSLIKNNEWFLPAERDTIISHIEANTQKFPSEYNIKNNYIKTLKILKAAKN